MAEEEQEERPDIKIDTNSNTATWELRADGLYNGTYVGTFRARLYLTPLQQLSASRDERALLGVNPALAEEHTAFLAYALAQLRYRLVSSPPFWHGANPNSEGYGGDLADESIISLVLDFAISAQEKHKNILKKRKEDAIKKSLAIGEQVLKQQALDAKVAEEKAEADAD